MIGVPRINHLVIIQVEPYLNCKVEPLFEFVFMADSQPSTHFESHYADQSYDDNGSNSKIEGVFTLFHNVSQPRYLTITFTRALRNLSSMRNNTPNLLW